MRRMWMIAILGVVAAGCLASHAHAITMFSDDFNNVASAANYSAIATDPASSFPTFAWDYSVLGIPSAPSSGDGSTLGLKMDANFSAPNAAEGLTVFTNAQYSGNYTVKFDAWLNANGPFPAGGSGSTNYLTAGVGRQTRLCIETT